MKNNRKERGQSIVEYALILVLLAVVVIIVLSQLGQAIKEVFSDLNYCLRYPQQCNEVLARRGDQSPSQPESDSITSAAILIGVSVKRDGDTVWVTARTIKTDNLVVEVAGQHLIEPCEKSCTIAISGIGDEKGIVEVSASDGSKDTARYASKAVAEVLQPEKVALTGEATVSLGLLFYLVRTTWWKMALQIASRFAASGKTKTALTLLQKAVSGGKLSSIEAEKVLEILHQCLIKNVSFKYFGEFTHAQSTFELAQRIINGMTADLAPHIKAGLFSVLGITCLKTQEHNLPVLGLVNESFKLAQKGIAEIGNLKTKQGFETQVKEGYEQLGQQIIQARQKQWGWASAGLKKEKEGVLYLARSYDLTTQAGWRDAPADTRAASIHFELPITLRSFDLDVVVWAQDMEVTPDHPQSLKLDPASDRAESLVFTLIPQSLGDKRIVIDLYYELHWVQQICLEVQVIEAPEPEMVEQQAISVETSPIKIGALLGAGGRDDQSFNHSACDGLKSARDHYDFEFKTADSGSLEENVNLLQQWAENDYDLIIAVGYDNAAAVTQVAKRFPKQRFAIIDAEVQLPNVWSAVFQGFEADYIVGALAALIAGNEGLVGFIGGVKTSVIIHIEAAFAQGIKDIQPDVVLQTVYVNRFDDENVGQGLAEMIYANGANIIYQAAGGSGIGAIRAADKLRKLIISTGRDHSGVAPQAVLTSRVKNLNRPIEDVIQSIINDTFEGGKTISYGLGNGGVSIIPIKEAVYERLRALLPPNMDLDDLIRRFTEVENQVTYGAVDIGIDRIVLGEEEL